MMERVAQLDEAAIQGLVELGGAELLDDLIEDYLRISQEASAAAQAAVEQGDTAAVVQLAHSLKSASGTLGAGDFSAVCAGLEAAGKRGDLEDVRALYTQFEPERAAADSALRARLSSAGSAGE